MIGFFKRKVEQRIERIAMAKIVGALLRHALTLGGGAGLAVSDSQIETLVSAIMILIGIAHSLYEKRTSAA